MGYDRMSITPPLESYPTRAPVHWSVMGGDSDKRTVVIVIEKDFTKMESIIARLLRAPGNLRRPLDRMNSTLWELMDGSRTLDEIVRIMDSTYNESIAPARERCSSSISNFVELNLVVIRTTPINGEWDVSPSEPSHR